MGIYKELIMVELFETVISLKTNFVTSILLSFLTLFFVVSCKDEITDNVRNDDILASVDTDGSDESVNNGPDQASAGDEEFTDESASIPSQVAGSFLVGKAFKQDGVTPVANAVVYLPESEDQFVFTDDTGFFKLPVNTDQPRVDLIILKEAEGLGKILSDIPAPNDQVGGTDLGNIILESTGALRGQFLLNAEDHPDMFRAGRKKLMRFSRFNVELWRIDQNGNVFDAPSDVDGSFLIRGIAPGRWRVKFFGYDEELDDYWWAFLGEVEIVAGRTTLLYPGVRSSMRESFLAR